MSDLQGLYANLSGTTSKDIVDTSSSVLESILLLKKINEAEWSKDPDLKQIADAEVKYVRAAAKAVASDLQIQNIYGKDLSAVLSVASVMKRREQERQGQEVLDAYIEGSDMKDRLTTAEISLNKMRSEVTGKKFRDAK